ncbi:PqqD family protein [Methanocella sp. CWC-04]|uniref:PqqD family protein n=1 Tax=Methanooceanicella nereidis TaxID=2052831 RepID=A0AAP2W624_9EURY|nr:PqqD family protein [Methanocella sp. CWC-04]MCD1293849.1 PqqD family protein [Methanocella sp. CWC-04]
MPLFVTFKGSGMKIPYKKLLLSKPKRDPDIEWDKMNSDVVKLYVPYKKTHVLKVLSKFVDIPDERMFRFNPLGSLVWELCDGTHTVQEIKDIIIKRSKGNEKDIEKRLFKFINKLIKNELVIVELS